MAVDSVRLAANDVALRLSGAKVPLKLDCRNGPRKSAAAALFASLVCHKPNTSSIQDNFKVHFILVIKCDHAWVAKVERN